MNDERRPCEDSRRNYYQHVPSQGWSAHCVSRYAAAHPHANRAETIAHCMHSRDALATIDCLGLLTTSAGGDWVERLMFFDVTLNELKRSPGTDDPYPVVLADPVAKALRFTDRCVGRVA